MIVGSRCSATDRALAALIGKNIHLGKAFAFVGAGALATPALSWVANLTGGPTETRPRVISLLARAPVPLPGASVAETVIATLSLAAVTSDKALYREGRDEAHLLALDPLSPGRDAAIDLRMSGADFASYAVTLDARGAAVITLRDLPIGEYEARFRGALDGSPACCFTVAEYRLAPLVASLLERRLEGERLTARIRLESFGIPVEGRVKLELVDQGARFAELTADAKAGLVEAAFTLSGAGPHAINLQLAADPSRTATVPIVGSRAAERSRTTLSTLGAEVTGSLLPGADSRSVRGIWLEEGAVRSTPFNLERVDTRTAKLTAVCALVTACVAVIDPTAPGAEREPLLITIDDVPAGHTIEIDVPGPMALLVIGAYVLDRPWEGWAVTIAPDVIAPALTVPEHATPGESARIAIDTGRGADDASVYLVVKDARLLAPDTPASRLAGGLKAYAEAASKALEVGYPSTTLADEIEEEEIEEEEPERMYSALPMSFSADDMPVPYGGGRASIDGMAIPRAAPAPERSTSPYRAAAPAPPRAVEEPEVLFAGLVQTQGGRGAVTVRLGADFADYVVEAIVVAGADWAPVEARFRAEKEVFVSLEVPAFVHADDAAIGRVHVGARTGARVSVTRDGAPVTLLQDGRPLPAEGPLAEGRSELTFLAGPGAYEASITESSSVIARASRQVEAPGKLRRIARVVRILEPGERLTRASDPAIVALRVLPGLDRPFKALVDATADYGHACCEQTAAKMLSACAMYALAEDAERRDRAEAILLAGVRREATMWLRGRGFKMYPESAPTPDAYWGPKAAQYLFHLGLLGDLRGAAAPGRALAGALEEGLAMASDAARAYSLTWPPREPSTCEDAYLALRFGRESAGIEAPLRVVRERVAGAKRGALLPGSGAVARRVETAYAAAALLRAGASTERALALTLADAVVQCFGEEGRLYSTVDSVAAIALMAELGAAKVMGDGVVEVDGAKLSTREASAHVAPVSELCALEGVVTVEVSRLVEEDWGAFAANLPIRVAIEKNGSATRRLQTLDAVELVVTLESGYKAGDLCWVCLPDALSRLVGGGQVKRFSVDFREQSELRIALAATSVTVGKKGGSGPARVAVCVRNMFEEERAGSPGLLEITVAPPGGGLLERALGALKGLFGG